MEGKGDGHEQKKLVEMLLRGRDAAKQFQLQLQLGQAASQELKEHLVETILRTFTNVFSILKHSDATSQQLPAALSNSPRSLSSSPKSNNSIVAFREPGQLVDTATKKRKMVPRWTDQVRASSEGQLEDGYNWRKYGQKDILGSKFPRSYYRCTHKSQGCQATKQVQRSDNDPSIFEVIYRGTHICPRLPTTAATSAAAATPTAAASDLPLPINFQMGLKVKTHELDNLQPGSPPLFSLPPPPPETTSTNGIAFLPSPAIVTPGIGTTSFFGSPATSELNYPGVCPVSWPEPGSAYEPANALSGPHSATSTGMVNVEFTENSIDHIEPNNFPFTFFFS